MPAEPEEEIFNPEAELSRLMKARFLTAGSLTIRLPKAEARTFQRFVASENKLGDMAGRRGILNSLAYWVLVLVHLVGIARAHLLAPNVSRLREFWVVNRRTIGSVEYAPCLQYPKCVLVRLARMATSNPALQGTRDEAARP